MMQPIITRDDSLARGIETAGGALGSVLMDLSKEKRNKKKFAATNAAFERALADLPEDPTATDLQKLISRASKEEDVDPEYFNQTLKNFLPLYQDRMKAGETARSLDRYFPNNRAPSGNNQPTQPQYQESPINNPQISQQMQQLGIAPFQSQNAMPSTPQQLQQLQQQQMQQPFSLQRNPSQFNQPQVPIPQLPQQQLQQLQQQQLMQRQQQSPLNTQTQQQPPLEQAPYDRRPTEQYSIYSPEFGEISRGKIDQMLLDPNPQIKTLAQDLSQRWNEQYKLGSKENADIRREYRDQIVKYSEPYQDINKLETGVNKLREAQKLIQSGRVSLDDNWVRNVVSGLLEGNESPLAEIVKTPEQQKLWYLLKDSLKSKEVGGSNPSTKEVLLAKTALPGDMKSQDANEYIIGNMLQNSENELYKGKTIREERGKAGTPSFIQFQSNVDDKVNKYSQQRQQEYDKSFADKAIKRDLVAAAKERIVGLRPEKGMVWIMTPNGDSAKVPVRDLDRLIKAGGVLING